MAEKKFNGNRSGDDIAVGRRKERLKTAGVFLGLLAILAILLYWMFPKTYAFGKSGCFSEAEVIEQAKRMIRYLDEDDFDSMRPMMALELRSEEMEKAIRDAKKQISDDFGEFRSWGDITLAEASRMGEHMAVAKVEASYENVGVTYTLSFSEALVLNGIYMK